MSMKAIQILTASVMIVIMAVNLAAVGFISIPNHYNAPGVLRWYISKAGFTDRLDSGFQQGEYRAAQWPGSYSISGRGIDRELAETGAAFLAGNCSCF